MIFVNRIIISVHIISMSIFLENKDYDVKKVKNKIFSLAKMFNIYLSHSSNFMMMHLPRHEKSERTSWRFMVNTGRIGSRACSCSCLFVLRPISRDLIARGPKTHRISPEFLGQKQIEIKIVHASLAYTSRNCLSEDWWWQMNVFDREKHFYTFVNHELQSMFCIKWILDLTDIFLTSNLLF